MRNLFQGGVYVPPPSRPFVIGRGTSVGGGGPRAYGADVPPPPQPPPVMVDPQMVQMQMQPQLQPQMMPLPMQPPMMMMTPMMGGGPSPPMMPLQLQHPMMVATYSSSGGPPTPSRFVVGSPMTSPHSHGGLSSSGSVGFDPNAVQQQVQFALAESGISTFSMGSPPPPPPPPISNMPMALPMAMPVSPHPSLQHMRTSLSNGGGTVTYINSNTGSTQTYEL